MKKLLLSLLMVFVCINMVFSADNMHLIPMESPIYDLMEDLYTLEGKAAPKGAKPWTRVEARNLLDKVSPCSTSSINLKNAIRQLVESNEDSKIKGFLGIATTPSIATHSNTAYDQFKYWKNPVLDNPLLSLNLGMDLYDIASADIRISLGLINAYTGIYSKDIDEFKDEASERYKEYFATNIPFVSKGGINIDVTDRASLTIGNEYINATVARGQLEWGNGISGNLMLGNTLPYHDYIAFGISNTDWFDFTEVVSFFQHPLNYGMEQNEEIKGINLFLGHRLEFRLIKDTLRLTFNESIMYQSKDSTLDMRILNPFLIMHGHYIAGNANSLLTLELEWSPIKNLQLYLSGAIDDIAVSGEDKAPAAGSTPNSWGIMGGLRFTQPISEGYLKINAEAVYLTPLLYHRRTGYNNRYDDVPNDHSLDYIGSFRYFNNNHVMYMRRYLSFPFGSDTLACYTGISYTMPGKWKALLDFNFLMHGVTDENSEIYLHADGDEKLGWISTANPFDPSENGTISYTFDIGIYCEYYFIPTLKLSSSLDFISVLNFKNEKDKNTFDTQFTVNMTYSYDI